MYIFLLSGIEYSIASPLSLHVLCKHARVSVCATSIQNENGYVNRVYSPLRCLKGHLQPQVQTLPTPALAELL
jgi:hypothetical protein